MLDRESLRKALLELRVFDRVLVRKNSHEIWEPAFFREKKRSSFYWLGQSLDITDFVTLDGNEYSFCVPYDGNEDLCFLQKPSALDWKRGDFCCCICKEFANKSAIVGERGIYLENDRERPNLHRVLLNSTNEIVLVAHLWPDSCSV